MILNLIKKLNMINLKVIILIMIEMKLIHLYNIKISKMKIKFYPKMNK